MQTTEQSTALEARQARAPTLANRLGRASSIAGALFSLLLILSAPDHALFPMFCFGVFTLLTVALQTKIEATSGTSKRSRKQALAIAAKEWTSILQRWNEDCSSTPFDEALAHLRELKLQIAQLPAQRERELAELANTRLDRARWKYLKGFAISDLASNQLTLGQRYKLSSFGIRTAADVDHKLADIPNLISRGAAEQLLAWHRMHVRAFEPPGDLDSDTEAIEDIHRRFDYLRQKLTQRLSEGPALLEQRRESILAARKQLEAPLNLAWEALLRARAQAP